MTSSIVVSGRWRPFRRGLEVVRASGKAVEHADDSGDREALLTHAFESVNRRASGGHHVLHHQAALAGLERRALDPALQPVRLAVLAHEEGLDGSPRGQSRAGHGVGAHGRASHRRRAHSLRLRRHELAQGAKAGRKEDRALGVDVVLRGASAGERHLADHEGVLAQLGDESLVGIAHPSEHYVRGSPSAGLRPIDVAVGSVIRLAAVLTSIVVLLGFAYFAVDEMDRGSKAQQTALGESTGTPASPRWRRSPRRPTRRPAVSAATARTRAGRRRQRCAAAPLPGCSTPTTRGQPRRAALLALLLYGAGLGLLANMLPKERTAPATIGARRSLNHLLDQFVGVR